MFNHVPKQAKYLLLLLAVIGGLLGGIVYAQGSTPSNSTMQELIERLVAEQKTFAVVVVAPVSTEDGVWTIPADLKMGNDIIGRRVIKEVGYDYFCVDEIGQGAIFTYCVPFSNIAYIKYA